MADWTTVACLLTLRAEFDRVSPHRDRGADGTIGDSAHTSSSDHTPDEDSSVLRDHDADSKNEVHALDIDSSGPWPVPGWFNATILALVERERADYESPTTVGRLQYVIWNGRIASRSWGWTWRDYNGADPHTNHAHFSARYVTAAEADTRPWGVKGDDVSSQDVIEALESAAGRKAIITALQGWTEENPDSTKTPKESLRIGGLLRMSWQREWNLVEDLKRTLLAIAQAQGVDSAAVTAQLQQLSAQVDQVDDQTVAAIFGGTDEQLVQLLQTALGDTRAAEIGRRLQASAA